MAGVKRTVLVLSGKGGVGKSTFSSQLAYSCAARGLKVGILDIDLCGPSIPRMMNVQNSEIHQCDEGWVPVYTDSSQAIAVMLKAKDDAVVWRGPKKNAMIKQFLTDVAWTDRDILIIDTPPGLSLSHGSLFPYLFFK